MQELEDLFAVLDGIGAALDGAGNRAGFDPPPGDAHEHLGAGAHQIFAVAEVHDETEGGGIDPFQPLEDGRGAVLAGFVKHLPRHNLKEIAAHEAFLGLLNEFSVFTRLMIAARHILASALKGDLFTTAAQPVGALRAVGKLVAIAHGRRGVMIRHQQIVGQKKHEITLIRGPFEVEFDRFELEREVIAKAAVKAEVVILIRFEMPHEGAQDRENRRRARAFLFVIDPVGFGDAQIELFLGSGEIHHLRQAFHHVAHHRQQDTPARIECCDAHLAAAGLHHHGRLGKAELPTGVAAGIFVIR